MEDRASLHGNVSLSVSSKPRSLASTVVLAFSRGTMSGSARRSFSVPFPRDSFCSL